MQNSTVPKGVLLHALKAQRYPCNATQREQWYVEAIADWAAGAINRAIQRHEAIAQTYSQDLISVQQGQYHYFYRGEATKLKRLAETVLTLKARQLLLFIFTLPSRLSGC